MAFIPTPNTARVAVEIQVETQVCVITLWFEADVPFTVSGLIDLATAVQDWVTDTLMDFLAPNALYIGTGAIAQDSDSAPSVHITPASPVAGTTGTLAQSPQVAAGVTFGTGLRGRSFRGRNYVPGIPLEASTDSGTITAGYLANLLGAYLDLVDVEDATDTTHVVVSHYAGGAARLAGVTTPITEYRLDDALDTQRRRSIGRGS